MAYHYIKYTGKEDHLLSVHDYIPLYKQIKKKIIEDISNGIYKPGDAIPTQKWFEKEYGVSRVTVRQAIVDLVSSGILYTQKGKGTFVGNIPLIQNGQNRLEGFTTNIAKVGYKAKSKILEIDMRPSNTKLENKLNTELGKPVLYIKRLRIASNIPVALENSYINYEKFDGLDFKNELKDDMSLYELIQDRSDIVLTNAEERIQAILSTDEISNHLKIIPSDPILFVKRLTYTHGNIPIEYCENYIRSDMYGVSVKYNKI